MVKSENLKNENTVLEHKYLSLGSKFTELKTENENLKTKIMNHDCFWEANTENEALNQITYSAFKNRFQTTAAWLNVDEWSNFDRQNKQPIFSAEPKF